jgi:small subunit ribosomal protein S4
MARYTDSVCKQCRREGMKLFLKGKRCFTPKCAFERRNYQPGMHAHGKRPSKYGEQLREKQKVKRMYGLLEKQFRLYFKRASRSEGVTGQRLLELLETRLDNIAYRLGWGKSRAQARQLVSHGHVLINNRKVTIPSYHVIEGQTIGLRERSLSAGVTQQNLAELDVRTIVGWLAWNNTNKTAEMVRLPKREEMDANINEQLIVEFYSR